MSFTKHFVDGQKGTGLAWRTWFGDHFSNFVGDGFLISEDEGLKVNIAKGRAYIKNENGEMFQVTSDDTENILLDDNDVSYIYLHCDNDSNWITVETSPTAQDDTILLGVVETEDGEIINIINSMRTTPLLRNIQPIMKIVNFGSLSHESTKHQQTYPMGSGSYCGDCSGAPKTRTTDNFYFGDVNYYQDKLVFISKIQFDLSVTTIQNTNWVKVYLNLGGSNILLENITENFNTQKIYTVNLGTTDPIVKPFMVFEINVNNYRSSCTSGDGGDAYVKWMWTCTYGGLSVSNLILDYSYQ